MDITQICDNLTFYSPFIYGALIILPFVTNKLFRCEEASSDKNCIINIDLLNLCNSNNRYYLGNRYKMYINLNEIHDELMMKENKIISNFLFRYVNWNKPGEYIVEFSNDNYEDTFDEVNTLLRCIAEEMNFKKIYVINSHNLSNEFRSIEIKDDLNSEYCKCINILDIYGFYHPNIRKIKLDKECLKSEIDDLYELDDKNENGIDEINEENDIISQTDSTSECEYNDSEFDEKVENEFMNNIHCAFKALKYKHKDIYNVMKSI